MGKEQLNTLIEEFENSEQHEEYRELEKTLQEIKESGGERNLVKILHRVQKIFGHVSREIQIIIAESLGIPLSEIYSVVSFYSLFTTEPRGDTTVEICMGTACYVKGSEDILNKFQEELEITPGEVTEDGKFGLETARCVGACGKAPVVVMDEDVQGGVSVEDVPDLLAEN
jgi:NADH:ubiquinone oxidoreductase subunit E